MLLQCHRRELIQVTSFYGHCSMVQFRHCVLCMVIYVPQSSINFRRSDLAQATRLADTCTFSIFLTFVSLSRVLLDIPRTWLASSAFSNNLSMSFNSIPIWGYFRAMLGLLYSIKISESLKGLSKLHICNILILLHICSKLKSKSLIRLKV